MKQKKKIKKKRKSFDYNYCMKQMNCKVCKYSNSCDLFSYKDKKINNKKGELK